MSPEQLTALQDEMNRLDDAYWNHRDTDYAEAVKAIADIIVPEQERLVEEASRWGKS